MCSECLSRKQSEGHKKKDELAELRQQLSEARALRLKDFQPRELMIRLRELGYEGTLTYTEKRVIDITKIN